MSVSELQTTEMKEMISINCNAEPIKLGIKTVTKDFNLFKKGHFITRLLDVNNLFKNKADDSKFKNIFI